MGNNVNKRVEVIKAMATDGYWVGHVRVKSDNLVSIQVLLCQNKHFCGEPSNFVSNMAFLCRTSVMIPFDASTSANFCW